MLFRSCQRVHSVDPQPITVESWADRADPDSQVVGPVVLAVDVPPDRASASIAVAGRREDGLAHLEVVRADPGTGWVVAEVARLCEAHEVASMTVAKKPRTAVVGDSLAIKPLVPEFLEAGLDPVLIGPSDMAAACAGLQDAVNARTMWHLGQEQVDIGSAVPRDVGESGWAWAKRKSNGDISPLVAVTVAHWALMRADEYDPAELGFY